MRAILAFLVCGSAVQAQYNPYYDDLRSELRRQTAALQAIEQEQYWHNFRQRQDQRQREWRAKLERDNAAWQQQRDAQIERSRRQIIMIEQPSFPSYVDPAKLKRAQEEVARRSRERYERWLENQQRLAAKLYPKPVVTPEPPPEKREPRGPYIGRSPRKIRPLRPQYARVGHLTAAESRQAQHHRRGSSWLAR